MFLHFHYKDKDSLIFDGIFVVLNRDILNQEFSKFHISNSTKVIITRLMLTTFFFLDNNLDNYEVGIGLTTPNDNTFAVTTTKTKNTISVFPGVNLESPIFDRFYTDKNNNRKFNIQSHIKGSHGKVFLYTHNKVDNIYFTDGGIGNDVIKYIYQNMMFGSCFGSVGVGVYSNNIINTSGFIIRHFSDNKEQKEFFQKVTENILPSKDLFTKQNFFNLFEIDESKIDVISEIKNITIYPLNFVGGRNDRTKTKS